MTDFPESIVTITDANSEVVSEEIIPLTAEEQQELGQLEEKIEQGLQGYYEAGLALVRIRDAKLYREKYSTFSVYCEKRWGISRSRAYQLLDAVEITSELSTNCRQNNIEVLPTNEAHTRPLSKLPSEDRVKAWQLAVESAPEGKVTMAHVAQVVKTLTAGMDDPIPERELKLDDPRSRYMNPHLVVGDKLKSIREDIDMSQGDLIHEMNLRLAQIGAIQLPLCQSVVSIIENGKRSMSLLEAIAAAHVLGISVYDFSPWEDLKNQRRAS